MSQGEHIGVSVHIANRMIEVLAVDHRAPTSFEMTVRLHLSEGATEQLIAELQACLDELKRQEAARV